MGVLPIFSPLGFVKTCWHFPSTTNLCEVFNLALCKKFYFELLTHLCLSSEPVQYCKQMGTPCSTEIYSKDTGNSWHKMYNCFIYHNIWVYHHFACWSPYSLIVCQVIIIWYLLQWRVIICSEKVSSRFLNTLGIIVKPDNVQSVNWKTCIINHFSQ